MNILEASFEILEPSDNIFIDIERAARTCYKSENKITPDSAKEFVENLIKKEHFAMLEHGTVYLTIPDIDNVIGWSNEFEENPYTVVNYKSINGSYNYTGYITTNYRVIVENNWYEYLKYKTECTEFHERRISVRFTCDRGITHELVRHRVFSFAQESTRFCNYGKDKFKNQLTYITLPKQYQKVEELLLAIESLYLELLENGWTPQEARDILPNCLKSEIIMTGTVEQWYGFFGLRCAPTTHPKMQQLAIPLKEEFKNRGWGII